MIDLDALSGHTPGPWTAENFGDGMRVVESGRSFVATMVSPSTADEALIAAAPDLLALCRALRVEIARITKIATSARESTRRERLERHIAETVTRNIAKEVERANQAAKDEGDRATAYCIEAGLLRAKADRLARILAVERGDASAAPSGWERVSESHVIRWVSHPANAEVWPGSVGAGEPPHWCWEFDWPGVRGSYRTGTADTALEAMEAADAARSTP